MCIRISKTKAQRANFYVLIPRLARLQRQKIYLYGMIIVQAS